MVVVLVLVEKCMRIEEDLVEHENDNVAEESDHLCQGEVAYPNVCFVLRCRIGDIVATDSEG